MRRYGWIAACLTVATFDAGAAEIALGDQRLSISVPEGFTELTPEMSPYYELMQEYVFPRNRRHLTLVSAGVAERLLGGEAPELGRYMNLETLRDLEAVPMSRAMFDEIRGALRTQLSQVYEQLAPQLPDIMDDASAQASEALHADIAASIGNMRVLPVHLDTANAIGHSMYMRGDAVVNGEIVSRVTAMTQVSLYVRDRLLYLYVYGDEADLEWTRSAAGAWATAILGANGSELGAARVPDEAGEEIAIEVPRNTMSRNQVLMGGLIGIALVLLLGSVLLRWRRKPEA